MDDGNLASSSFADDLCLLATSLAEVELLVSSYQLWCQLLRVQIHVDKTELHGARGQEEHFEDLKVGHWALGAGDPGYIPDGGH